MSGGPARPRAHAGPALLLFDIDGTLLLSGGEGARAMQTVVRRLFGDGFTFEGVEFAGNLDHLIFADAATRSRLERHEEHHEAFRDAYVQELTVRLSERRDAVRVMPGIVELLRALHDRAERRGDVVLGLLSGNYRQAAPVKLEAAGIDPGWFQINALGDEAATRSELVALAMRRYRRRCGMPADPRRVIVIGDTPRDVACAKANGCVAFTVATGSYSVSELLEAGADEAVQDLSDPRRLLARLDE